MDAVDLSGWLTWIGVEHGIVCLSGLCRAKQPRESLDCCSVIIDSNWFLVWKYCQNLNRKAPMRKWLVCEQLSGIFRDQ